MTYHPFPMFTCIVYDTLMVSLFICDQSVVFSSLTIYSFIYFSRFYFPDSGQAVVTGVVPSPPPGSCLRFLSRIGFSDPTGRRFFIECSLTHALALSATYIPVPMILFLFFFSDVFLFFFFPPSPPVVSRGGEVRRLHPAVEL